MVKCAMRSVPTREWRRWGGVGVREGEAFGSGPRTPCSWWAACESQQRPLLEAEAQLGDAVMEDAFRACGSPALRPLHLFISSSLDFFASSDSASQIRFFPQVEMFPKCFSTRKLAAEGSIRGTLITFPTLPTFI